MGDDGDTGAAQRFTRSELLAMARALRADVGARVTPGVVAGTLAMLNAESAVAVDSLTRDEAIAAIRRYLAMEVS